MNGMNKVILLGSLGAPPELRVTQSGTPVLSMRLATNERFLDKNKEWKERVEWHSVVCFGARAEGLAKVLTKGSSMCIEGSLHTSSYEKDGVKRYKVEVIAKDVMLVGGKGGGQRQDDGDGEPQGDYDDGARPRGGGGSQRGKPAQRQASGGGAGGSVPGDFEVKFGRDKGQMMSQVADLTWLRDKIEGDINDPKKHQWHANARKQLAAIDAELARRESGGAAPPARAARAQGGAKPRAQEPEGGGGEEDGGDFDEYGMGGDGGDDGIPF